MHTGAGFSKIGVRAESRQQELNSGFDLKSATGSSQLNSLKCEDWFHPRVLEKPKFLSLGQVFFSPVFKSCLLSLRRSLARTSCRHLSLLAG